MDGQNTSVSAGSPSAAYDQPLFSAALSPGQHMLELSGDSFDVDYIVVTEGDGDASYGPPSMLTRHVLINIG
jgi:hypothetical protein